MADIQSYLQGLNVPQNVKADAWDAFHNAPDHDSFVKNVGKLNLPQSAKADMYDMRFGGASAPSPVSGPMDQLSANKPSLWNEAKQSIANSAIGHSLQETMPKAASALGLVPSENTGSSTYEQHGQQLISPDYLAPHISSLLGQKSNRAKNVTEGVLSGVGGLTSGQNMALMGAAAATGGLAGSAAFAGIGAPQALGFGFGVQGLKGLYDSANQIDALHAQGRTDEAQRAEGELIPNAIMAGLGGHLAGHGMLPEEAAPAERTPVTPGPTAPPSGAGRSDAVAFSTNNPVEQQQYQVLKDFATQRGSQPTPALNEELPLANGGGVLQYPRQEPVRPKRGLALPAPKETLALPAPSETLSASGESIAPQTAEAGPMSPEAEAVSKEAQDKTPGQPQPVNYVTKNGDVDYDATLKGLPPVPGGYTRLFRSESPTNGFNDTFKADGLGAFNENRPEGKSYTTDLPYAEYFKSSYGKDATTHYVDVPHSVAEASRFKDNEFVLGNNSPHPGGDLSPSESVTPKVDPRLGPLEDEMRPQIGQVMRLSQLLEGDQNAKALQRGIDATNDLNSPAISAEDRATIGAAIGQDVGSALTPDQMDMARQALGHEQGTAQPKVLNTDMLTAATRDRVAQSRDAMLDELVRTDDPQRQAQLTKALQPDEQGNPKNVLFHADYAERAPVDLHEDHPETPFASKGFDHAAPEITIQNLKAALGKVRSKDLGMLTPDELGELRDMRKQANATSTPEGEGTVNENTNGMGYENLRKNADSDYTARRDELHRTAVQRKLQQVVNDLRTKAQTHASLRDGAETPLTAQLKKLPQTALRNMPKELRDLAQTEEHSTATANGTKSQESAPTPDTGEKASGSTTSAGRTAGRSAAQTLEAISKDNPEQLGNAKALMAEVKDHFGKDFEGSLHGANKVLSVFQAGLKADDPYAMRKALMSLRRMTPHDGTESYASGLDPKYAKEIARVVAPKLTDADNMKVATFAADSIFKRYEKMTSTERSAYAERLHSEELDRLVQDADPKSDLSERLDSLRADLPKPKDTLTAIANLFAANPERFARDSFKSMVRKASGSAFMRDLAMKEGLRSFADETSKWSIGQSMDFIHKMERGMPQGEPFLNQLASTLRDQLDLRRDQMKAMRPDVLEYFYKDYFPHIWSNVGRASQVFSERADSARLSGPEGFLKQREHEFFEDGIKAGLDPISYDPIKLAMTRMQQMDRFIKKEEIKGEMIKRGMAQFVKNGDPVPAGFKPLTDRSFEQNGGHDGRYYAAEGMARDFNTKFASQGLTGKWNIGGLSVYDGLRSLNNSMNIAKLSLSGLHATESGLNSSASELTRGIQALVNDHDVTEAAKRVGLWSTIIGPVVRDLHLGGVIPRALKNPQAYAEYSDTVRAFEVANGRIGIDPFYGTHFGDALQRNWKIATDENKTMLQRGVAGTKAAMNSVGKTLELMSWPIMNFIVPRLKIAAFHHQVMDIMAHSDGTNPEAMDRDIQQAWDNVDNRFGEMVYDNTWMNRTTKDIMSLTMLSPGWNIGTIRLFRDAGRDLGKTVSDAKSGKGFHITNATAYIPAMVATTMLAGAIFQHLHPAAGAMTFKDYLFPRDGTKDQNGDDNRYRLKSYLGDAISAFQHPLDTAMHKQSPLFSATGALYQNRDYYGKQVYDPGASSISKAFDMTKFMASQYKSFSIDNYQEAASRGSSGFASIAMNSAGFSPAPREMQKTDAENLASKYFTAQSPYGSSSAAEFDKRQQVQKLRAGLRSGDLKVEDIAKQVQDQKLDLATARAALQPRKGSTLQYEVSQLKDAGQAMRVFQAATPEEQATLLTTMIGKAKKLSAEERTGYVQQIQQAAENLARSQATHVYDHATGAITPIGR